MEEERERQRTPALSEREEQILKFAMRGFTDTAIANKLGISEATVGTYWGRVRIKMGPYSRTELVARALREQSETQIEQLRAENQRLLQQMQALDFANADEQSVNMARSVLESAPDAILIVNEQGTIEFLNRSTLELFGYERHELLGERLSKLIPERFREVHDTHRAEYLSHPEKRKMGEHLATPAVKKDGTEFPVAATLSAIENSNGVVVTCIVRDATQSLESDDAEKDSSMHPGDRDSRIES